MSGKQMFDGVSRREILMAFWQGLKCPSLGAVTIAFGSVAGFFLLICLFLTPAFWASGAWRYVMTDDLDVQTYVTQKVLSRPPSEPSSVVLLGTSVTIRCVESEKALSDLISKASGRLHHVHDLATDAQMTWEMAALTEQLPPGPGGVLVIGLTPGILATGPSDNGWNSLATVIKMPKLGFTSAALDEEARHAGISVPVRTGIYGLDNAKFFLSRRRAILRNFFRGGMDYADPLTAFWYADVNRPEFWREEVAALSGVAASYDTNAAYNFYVIARFIERARNQNPIRVIILESPINPSWQNEAEGAAFFARYRTNLQAFAAKQNAAFLTVSESAGLKAEDFVDYEGHIGNEAARRRCTEILAEGVAHELRRDI